MTKNNDGRKHWRFGRIYEKEQAQLWNFLRKAWENFGATVLAKTVAAKLKIKTTTTTTKIQLSALFGINWRALSQWACWNMGTVAFQSFHS